MIDLIQIEAARASFPRGEDYPTVGDYTWKFLAQGDSWFSFGSLPPWDTGNLLNGVSLRQNACAVNCARPGKELERMTDTRRDPYFHCLLVGSYQWKWDGILLSGGGDDLIAMVKVQPSNGGVAVDPSQRLLLTPLERGAAIMQDPTGYVSEAGWVTLTNQLTQDYAEIVSLRDDRNSESKGTPIFTHAYDFIMPCHVGAAPGIGPWLFPAMGWYQIPQEHWFALSKYLMARLNKFLCTLNFPNFYVAQTQGTCIPSLLGATGPSNDFANEIHPNPGGYKKLGAVYSNLINHTL